MRLDQVFPIPLDNVEMESSSTPIFQRALECITFTVVDVETTGLEPAWGHRLCEIAIVLQQGGRELDAFTQSVNPERPIDLGAQAVYGIAYEELQDAPHFSEIAPVVRAYLEHAVVVGHNVLFDVGFLAAEWRRLRWPPPCVHFIDTLALARYWLGLTSNRLPSVADTLDIPTNAAHSALDDARITAQVLQALIRILNAEGIVTLGDLIDAQGSALTWPHTLWDELLYILWEALVHRRGLWLCYVAGAGIITERRVEPLDTNDGTVKGDLIVFARVVHINGAVEGDLISFAQAIAMRGVVQDDARVAAQAFVVEKGGRIGDDINAAGYSITLEEGSDVGGDVWIAASQVVLAGYVVGDLAGGGESVRIAGNIGGNVETAVADGEAGPGFSLARFLPALPEGFHLPEIPYGLSVTPDARVAGKFAYASRVPITLPEGVVRGEVIHRRPEMPVEEEMKQPTEFGSFGWAIDQVQRLLRLLLVGLLAVWLASRWLRRASVALRVRPFSSLGWGVLSPFALLVFVVVAGLVILGVAVLLSYVLGSTALLTLLLSVATGTVVVIYLMLVFYVGALVSAYAVGERILRAHTIRPIWVMLLGIGVLWVLTLIPMVGIFVGIVFALFGLGAIWLAVRRVEGIEVEASPVPS